MPGSRHFAVGWVVAGLLVCATVSPQSAQQRLAAATRLDCRFPVQVTGNWDEADGTPSVTVMPAELEASFRNVDTEQGTAEAAGRIGTSYIIARFADGALHLVQMIDIGPVYVTTVFAEERPDGRFNAVHTRHRFAASSYPEFRERPEMYLGDCALGHD